MRPDMRLALVAALSLASALPPITIPSRFDTPEPRRMDPPIEPPVERAEPEVQPVPQQVLTRQQRRAAERAAEKARA